MSNPRPTPRVVFEADSAQGKIRVVGTGPIFAGAQEALKRLECAASGIISGARLAADPRTAVAH